VNWTSGGQAYWNAGCGSMVIPPPEEHADHEQVSVCLVQPSAEEPYRMEVAPVTAIINGKGVPRPGGPASDPVIGVFPDEPWGAIIPPFVHPSGQEYAGLNWTGGRAIWEADCVYVPPAPPAPSGSGGASYTSDADVSIDAPVVAVAETEPVVVAAAETDPVVVAAAAAAQDVPVVETPVLVTVPEQARPPLAVDAGEGPGGHAPWSLLVLLAAVAGAVAGTCRLAGPHEAQASEMTRRGDDRDGRMTNGVSG
jgi:hypothetical protein